MPADQQSFLGVSIDQIGRNSTQTIRSLAILRAITGNIDIPGGELLGGYPEEVKGFSWDADMDCHDKLPEGQRRKQLGSDRFKLETFPGWELMCKPYRRVYGHDLPNFPFTLASQMYVYEAILTGKPYPVKAFIAQGNNPLLAHANTKKAYEALKRLDLLVVMDYWLTPTAMLADYVLPAANWLERTRVNVGSYECDVGANII
jgi:anaerobic selenocysteine-containing dehydrogenase